MSEIEHDDKKYADQEEEEETFKPINQTYSRFCFCLALGVMYPNPNNEKKRLVILVLALASFVPVYCIWWFDVINCLIHRDLDNLTRQISIGLPSGLVNIKMILSYALKKEFTAIFEALNADYEKYNSISKEYKQIVKENIKLTQRYETLWHCVMGVTVSIFPLMAVVLTLYSSITSDEPERVMIHDMDMPWIRERRYETPCYELMFIYELYIAYFFFIGFVGYDGIYSVFIYHICLKMKLFCHRLRKCMDNPDDIPAIKRDIAIVVEDQCETFKFIELLQDSFEFWLVTIIVLTVFEFCMILYQVVATAGSGIDFRYVVFIFGGMAHVYVPCLMGSKVSSSAEDVAHDAYASKWEDVEDSVVRRSLNIIIARAQKPVEITALNMLTFNMDLFVWIIQTSYSVLTLLRPSD